MADFQTTREKQTHKQFGKEMELSDLLHPDAVEFCGDSSEGYLDVDLDDLFSVISHVYEHSRRGVPAAPTSNTVRERAVQYGQYAGCIQLSFMQLRSYKLLQVKLFISIHTICFIYLHVTVYLLT